MLKETVLNYVQDLNEISEEKSEWEKRQLLIVCRQKLVKKLFKLVKDSNSVWNVSEQKNSAIVKLSPDLEILIQEIPQSYEDKRNNRFFYCLLLIEKGEIVGTFYEECGKYTETEAYFGVLPIVDLYDLVIKGERRFGSLEHCCGASGFGQGWDDWCPACSGRRSLFHKAHELPY